jgi:hypothetical protein
LLNVLAAYLVRAVDHIRKVLPASYRRARDEEALRIDQLSAAATSDNSLYAALAAEASRLRLHQLLGFFIAFIFAAALVLALVEFRQILAAEMTTTVRVQAALLVIFLVPMAVFRYATGLDNGKRAKRLDIALRTVQRNRALPIMD